MVDENPSHSFLQVSESVHQQCADFQGGTVQYPYPARTCGQLCGIVIEDAVLVVPAKRQKRVNDSVSDPYLPFCITKNILDQDARLA